MPFIELNHSKLKNKEPFLSFNRNTYMYAANYLFSSHSHLLFAILNNFSLFVFTNIQIYRLYDEYNRDEIVFFPFLVFPKNVDNGKCLLKVFFICTITILFLILKKQHYKSTNCSANPEIAIQSTNNAVNSLLSY